MLYIYIHFFSLSPSSESRAKYGMTSLLLMSTASSAALMTGRLYQHLWRPVRLYLMFVVSSCFLVMCLAYSAMARMMLRRAAEKRRKAARNAAAHRRTSSSTASTDVTTSTGSESTSQETTCPQSQQQQQQHRMKISTKPS